MAGHPYITRPTTVDYPSVSTGPTLQDAGGLQMNGIRGAAIANAMKHPDKLGAGAAKRKNLTPKEKVTTVMKEWKRGTLHSGSGGKVTSQKQAIAIALNSARKNK